VTFTINVDTGGTFTDVYVVGPIGVTSAKSDTTPHDLTVGILEAIRLAAERSAISRPELLAAIDTVRFSTTIGTNTLVTRTGPRVGVLAGAGLVERVGADLAPALPLPAELIEPVPEPEVDTATLAQAVRSLLERGARIIVVVLSSGSGLEARERALRDQVAQDYPRHYLGAVPVLSSHQVTVEPDERVRFQTAVVDAYLHPVMSRALYKAEDQLRDEGSRHPLLVATGDAGTSRVAKTTAIRTWGSGPAGAVAGAAELAQRLGVDEAVIVDVGGTTTDVGIVRKSAWAANARPRIGGIEVSVPIVDLVSIGAGGGSIARVVDGDLRVGPESAGALPGPACFGLGGSEATVTDALLHLGIFDPERFLGGRRVLDPELAERAVKNLAAAAGRPVDELALEILERAGQAIADRVTGELESRGMSPSRVALFATGGAGGLFAQRVAAFAGLGAAYVFPFNAAFSAFGLSCLDLVHGYELATDGETTAEDLLRMLRGRKERAQRDMRGEGFDVAEVTYWVEVSPTGEGGVGEVVPLAEDLQPTSLEALLDAAAGGRQLRLKASLPRRAVQFPPRRGGGMEPVATRAVAWDGGARVATPVHAWEQAPAGATIPGPAILEADDATVVVPPGASTSIGSLGEAVFTLERPT
jgi:N-methylhydantoinase A/oxoprolinase/acetone carboxylase beta subunit